MARGRRRSRRKDPVPGWIWMLGGFSLGLIVALGIYLSERLPSPGGDRSAPVARVPAAEPSNRNPTPEPVTRPATAGSASASPAAEDAGTLADESVADATEFEFYEVLPEFEVVVPDTGQELRADPRAVAEARAGNYIVQAGSFRALNDADRMQARLALLGFESEIQRVAIDANVYHRVRIGPVTDLAELNRIRRRLRDERIDYLLIDMTD